MRLLVRSCTVDMFTSQKWIVDDVTWVQPPLPLRKMHLWKLICQDWGTYWWNKHQEDSYWRRDYRNFFIYLPTESIIYHTLLFWSYSKRCLNDVDASCSLFLSCFSQESLLWRTLWQFVVCHLRCCFVSFIFESYAVRHYCGNWFPICGCFLVQAEIWSDRKRIRVVPLIH